jgi:hypothetical protein
MVCNATLTPRHIGISREACRPATNRSARREYLPGPSATHETFPPRSEPTTALGTTLVPTATSNTSRSSTDGDNGDAGDAHGHIYTDCRSAGGRKVAGSNPAAPTIQKPGSEAGFRHFRVSSREPERPSWYRSWYQLRRRGRKIADSSPAAPTGRDPLEKWAFVVASETMPVGASRPSVWGTAAARRPLSTLRAPSGTIRAQPTSPACSTPKSATS